MNDVITLDTNYSTTRRVIKADRQVIAGQVKQSNKPEDKFETVLYLPEGEDRQGEGGLRTKGYFKTGGIIPNAPIAKSANTYHCERSGEIHFENPSLLTESLTPEANPLITVVTVVYNGEKFLEETILSVINQTYDNVEYIIIDGGSTDGTLDIIKKYEHAIDYWVSEKDEGIYDAMNKGCELAIGKGLNFLNAGDVYLGDVIPDDPVFPLAIPYKIKYSRLILNGRLGNFKMGMPLSHQAIFYENKKVLYDLTYTIAADYKYTIQTGFFDGNIIFYKVDGCVLFDGSGISTANYRLRDVETLKIIKSFYPEKAMIFLLTSSIKNLMKSMVEYVKFR